METIRDFDAFQTLKPVWNRLLSQSDNDIPYMTFEWFCFFWKKLCRPGSPLILVVRRGRDIAAILPLMRSRISWRSLPVTCLSFLSNAFAARTGMILLEKPGNGIWQAALSHLEASGLGFDIFWVERVVKGSDTDRLLRSHVAAQGLRMREMESNSSPYIPVSGSWNDYLQGRSKHQRSNIRHVNKLYEKLGHSLRTITCEGLEEAAEKMLYISGNSWKHRDGKAITNQQVKVDFYRDLLSVAAKEGWLRFHLLEIQGTPAGFLYTIRYKDKLYLLEIYYNEAMKEFSPGNYLCNRVLKEAFDTGCSECEFLGNTDAWKLRLTSTAHAHCKYWIFSSAPYGALLYGWEKGVVGAARFVKARLSRTAEEKDQEAEPVAA